MPIAPATGSLEANAEIHEVSTEEANAEIHEVSTENVLLPFALQYMVPAPASSGSRSPRTATSRQTREDGEEEADTDWDDT